MIKAKRYAFDKLQNLKQKQGFGTPVLWCYLMDFKKVSLKKGLSARWILYVKPIKIDYDPPRKELGGYSLEEREEFLSNTCDGTEGGAIPGFHT